VDAAGNFDIRGVPPGAYTLNAMVNEEGARRQARISVEVGTTNLEGLNVTVGPGASLKGRVRVDADGQPADLSNLRILLQPRDPGVNFGGIGPGKPNAEGTFELLDVFPDHYTVVLVGLPAGSYVKSIRSEPADVLAAGLDVSSGVAAPLEIVISPKAATVSGVVQNAETGSPAPGAMVVLVPQEKERREQQSEYRQVFSDQSGAYSLTGVPPGEYRAYAWADLEYGAYMDPDVMKPVESKGEAVTLKESDHKTVPLKLIQAEAPPAAK
jgi:hypothetical protein